MENIKVRECRVSSPGQTLFYYKAGSGGLPLFVFHGFGQSHRVFESWISHLERKYTLLLIDVYFHGKSTWTDVNRPLEKAAWKEAVELILQQENITTFSLSGYSLGGKFALATLEAFPALTKELYLIAPDGVTRNLWYAVATGSAPLRKLFQSMIVHDRRFSRLAQIAKTLRLADRTTLRFAASQMNTAAKRQRVFNVWVVFRRLRFDMRRISALIDRHGIAVTVIAGQYDRIVPPHALKRPLKRLKDIRFHVVRTGHNDLIAAAVPFLAERGNS